jgi:hypothetical protein
MGNSKDVTDEAVEMGNAILIALDEHKAEPNLAQAALGYAWYSLCKGMRIPASSFKEMTRGMEKMYSREAP